jgi:probable O-glycosylation ligase (exosortase A-associated)
MSTISSYETELSAQSRFASWEYAVDVASKRIVGGGFGVFVGRSDAHSIYFEVLGEHGIIGLALFLALGLFTWFSASRIRRTAEETEDLAWMGTLARMTQVSLVAYGTAGAFLGMAYFDFTYNLVLIVVVCKAILAARQTLPKPGPAADVGARPRMKAAAVPGERRRLGRA